ncbi:MAG TPA: alpha/beta hydrolase [Gemmatimonadaceae bacterium]
MSAGGFVHVWEPARDRSPRTLLLLHGTGGDERDLLPVAAMLDPAAAVLSPRGKVLEHGAPRFFKRLAMGVFDLDDLRERTHELADFVAAAAADYGFDAAQVTAVGFSNGANIAAAMMLLRPDVLAAAVLFRAMVPLEPDPRPDLRGRGVFLSAGRADTMVPGENTERLAKLLRDCGAGVELQWSPGGHGLTADDIRAAKAWLG